VFYEGQIAAKAESLAPAIAPFHRVLVADHGAGFPVFLVANWRNGSRANHHFQEGQIMDQFSGIDVSTETLLFLAEASRRLPRTFNGKGVHTSAIWRWMTRGLKNDEGEVIRLEFIEIGGRICTSEQALRRFLSRLKGRDMPRLRLVRNRTTKAMDELRMRGCLQVGAE